MGGRKTKSARGEGGGQGRGAGRGRVGGLSGAGQVTLGVDALPACEAPYLLVPSTFAPGFTLLSSSRAPGASAVCNFCNALDLSRAEHAPRAGQQSNALRAGLGGRQDGPLSARGVI